MPAFFGYVFSVIVLAAAVVLGAMKLTEADSTPSPAKTTQMKVRQPAKAALYAAKRKPAAAPADKKTHVAAPKNAHTIRQAQRPHLPPEFYGADEPAAQGLGFAAEPPRAFPGLRFR